MKKSYIPIEVENRMGITENWYLDISNLGLGELINLKDTLTGLSIPCLDAVIYGQICTSTFVQQSRQEQREHGRKLIKKRIHKNSGYKDHKKRR